METLLIAAGASATTAASVSATAGTLISVGSTALSAVGMYSSGKSQQAANNYQARNAELQAKQEQLKGMSQALATRDELHRANASQKAIFATRGQDLSGYGSATAAYDASRDAATRDLQTIMYGANVASTGQLAQSSQYRAEGKAAAYGGYVGAVSTAMKNKYVQKTLLEGL